MLADVRGGFVSRASAEAHYGVVLADDGASVDAGGHGHAPRPAAGRRSSSIATATTRCSTDGRRASTGRRALIVGIDTGGTFTDVTLLDPATGRVWTAKTPSTPDDPSRGFGNGIAEVLKVAGLAAPTSPACCTARRSRPT